ncbi:uncharacterized protein K441DRAFT_700122 [Cenococcum geophilum 1.58]|uniref:uncharacterized protein n=1 Tax=Cenococcum geophilum 1.58 TaxID=794803 RepID=UPI00358F4D99|nr:hypothetical protein K441DRAFT_700122 [Cenococcum geophilum 1.58]
MDPLPLTALSLAAAICQLVDFSTKVVHEGSQIFKSGTSIDVRHTQQLDNSTSQNSALTPEGQTLVDLANECDKVAQALLQGIQQVTVRPMSDTPGKPKPRLRSMYAALKLVWSSERLCLSRYREEISLRLLVILNTHQRVQNQKLDQLKQGNQDIVEVPSVQCNTLRLKLEAGHHHYTQLVHIHREAAGKRHAETIAAVLTSQEGQSRTITCPQSSQNLLKESVNSGQSFMARTLRGNRAMGSSAFQDYDTASTVELTRITDGILNALEFHEMGEST